MRKGIQIQRRQIVALILLFLILVELGAALFFVGLHFASIGSFDNLSPTDLVPAIAALGCIIVGIFAGRRSYAILARKGSRRTRKA